MTRGRTEPTKDGPPAVAHSPSNHASEAQVPSWLLPRAALLLGTLVAANPIVMLALFENGVVTTAVLVGTVVALQAAYKPGGRSLVFGYAVNFLVVGFVLLHAEYGFRTFLPDHVVPNIYRQGDGYFFNLPFLRLTFEDEEYRAVYVTNVQGIRIGEVTDPGRAIEKADWVFVGDSFTQGAQVPFDALYTSRLYKTFTDRIIVNLGASGLGVAQELSLYRALGARLKPSTVFLQISPFNDFMNVEPRRVGFWQRFMQRSAIYRTAMQRWRFEDPRLLPLRRWTEPFYSDSESNRRFNVFYRETSPGKERDLKLFQRYVREFKDAVEKDGTRLVLVLLPTREQVSTAALTEVEGAFAIDSEQLDMLRPNELVASVGRELGLQVIDLLPRLREEGAGAFFEWDEHLTPQGHVAVAEGITEAIIPWAVRAASWTRIVPVDSARYPRPSCGGTRLSYQALVRGTMEVFTVDSATHGVTQLTFDGTPKSHPVLSANCDLLLYTLGESESKRTEVVLMELPTGRTTVLTLGFREYGAIPTFSPDGRYVAYAEWQESGQTNSLTNPVLVVLDLVSKRKRYVTESSHESWRPVFSPDGRSLVFIANPAGQFDIYQADLATGRILQLTATPYDEWDPSYSQFGQKVIYAGWKDGNWDLFLVDVQSRHEQRLTLTNGDEWDPVFGPGDESVFFAAEFGMFAGIYEMPFDPKK